MKVAERPIVHIEEFVTKLWVVPAVGMLLPLIVLLTVENAFPSEDLLGALFITFGIGFVVLLLIAILKSRGVIDPKQRSIRVALWLAFIDGVAGFFFSLVTVGNMVH